MFPGYEPLAQGDVLMWAMVIGCTLFLVGVFMAVTVGKAAAEASDRRRHAGYLRDTHNGTNA